MPPKPQTITGYSAATTELAERVLLEVWSRLGAYRPHLVLVGGLVPRYLINQRTAQPYLQGQPAARHCGSMDVDLGISLAVADLHAYRSIRDTLVGTLGFRPGTNPKGREQRHSFVTTIGGTDVNIDFLTTRYHGPDNSLLREMESELSAIQVDGLGLALTDPLDVPVTGLRLAGGLTTELVRVCRPVPFVALKALAYEDRREPKDAYDLVYLLTYFPGGAAVVANLATDDERRAEAFQRALAALDHHFASPEHDGPGDCVSFNQDPAQRAPAFAAVQEFLRNLPK